LLNNHAAIDLNLEKQLTQLSSHTICTASRKSTTHRIVKHQSSTNQTRKPANTVNMPTAAAVDLNGSPAPGRLLILSNRLPITIKRSEDGTYNFSMSSGGLVTGLSGLAKTTSFQWYGWPGLEVPENEVDVVEQRLKDAYNAHAVFVDDELADRHYNGFSSMS
jgi:hypothetical protein